MPMLTCKAVTFYSEGDELAFFKWIESINCIKKFEGIGNGKMMDDSKNLNFQITPDHA